MNEKKVNIHELIEQTMEALLAVGVSKQTVWGSYSRNYLPVGKFFKKQRCEYYDVEILAEYCLLAQKRFENKEISAHTLRVTEKAVENIIEVHDTGKIIWSYQAKKTKFKLTDYFQGIATGFLEANESVNHLEWGVRKYLFYLQQNGHTNFDDITRKDLQHFIFACSEQLSNGSLSGIIGILRRFYQYLKEEQEIFLDDSILLYCSVVREYKIQAHLSWDEIEGILKQIDLTTDTGKRDYAIILLGIRTGMRAIDIISLRLKDIDWKTGTISILQEKTDVPLILPLVEDVGKAIKEYILTARPKCDSEYIFIKIKTPHTRMAESDSIRCIFNKYQKQAGIERKPYDGKGFHALRRTIGRNMAKSGVPITTIAQVLGQTAINSTRAYISFDNDNLKNCALDFSGIEIERGDA